MEFRRVAFEGESKPKLGDDGELIMRPVLDESRQPVLKRGKPVYEPETEYVPIEGGAEVYETTERFPKLEARLYAEALKSFRAATLEKIEHVAGGPIVLRVRRGR